MGKIATSIRFPDELVEALDRRAAALGLTRSELIIRAVEKALEEDSGWSPAFREALSVNDPELEAAADQMMREIRRARTRSRGPRL
jgi:predicted DNA-binding protein